MKNTGFRQQLEIALAGMTYPSEGDFQPLTVCEIQSLPKGRPVKYDQFMQPRLTGPHQQARYTALNKLMGDNLTDLQALVAGSVNVTIYVVGRLKDQPGMIGWTTTAVQT